MSTQAITVPQAVQFDLGGQNEAARLHLVIDADHYWLPASPGELSRISEFLGSHPGIELTLVTKQPAWDACLALDACPGTLPRHIVAGDGQEILHLTLGGEWEPDLVFREWKSLLESPLGYMEPEPFMPQAAAIDFLECNWSSPRPLFVCLEREGMEPLLRMADGACLPRSWGSKVWIPADTVFLFQPSLEGILQTLKSRIPVVRQKPESVQIPRAC